MKARDAQEEQDTRTSLDTLSARGGDEHGCSAPLFEVKKQHLEFLEAKKGHLYNPENPFAVPVEYRFLHGNCLYRLGHLPEAMEQFRLAVKADPGYAPAWNNLVALLLESGDRAQARTELARAEATHVVLRPALRTAVLGDAVVHAH